MTQFIMIVFVVITFTILIAGLEPDRTPMERLYDDED